MHNLSKFTEFPILVTIRMRALSSWFGVLNFFIVLGLRLDSLVHGNWFIILLPLWIIDFFLIVDPVVYLALSLQHNLKCWSFFQFSYKILKVILTVVFKILIALRLEYDMHLELYQILTPLWILLGLLILDVSVLLFKSPPDKDLPLPNSRPMLQYTSLSRIDPAQNNNNDSNKT
ncbi:PREDICTED: transmembrane protein 60-like [Nicrophorus vespilloides]|uniref:Transmembrane protein 60-like n=1 Tax=Nicrophorus vespilloides TaxID=110193 RepID=A0ABM1MCN3_NICVS|nr:PREDICTED: transmembrane protein 60-like [Nicrophorus vespilloides]